MSDNLGVSATMSPTRLIYRLSQAGFKRMGSVFRDIGVGREHPHWQERAEICTRCPMCVTEKRHAYCGKPFLKKIDRDEATEGCGCPILAKAKDPAEHCPRNRTFEASSKTHADTCDCVWCVALRAA
jgi:hypothetical protein